MRGMDDDPIADFQIARLRRSVSLAVTRASIDGDRFFAPVFGFDDDLIGADLPHGAEHVFHLAVREDRRGGEQQNQSQGRSEFAGHSDPPRLTEFTSTSGVPPIVSFFYPL